MKKILSAILAVVLLVGMLVVPSSAAFPDVVDDTGTVDHAATLNQYLNSNNEFKSEREKLENMTLSYEKDGYQLWVDEKTGEVATYELATGRALFSNPIDVASSSAAHANSTRYELMSQIIVKYLDNGDPKTFTSFEQAAMNGQIDVVNIRNGLRVEYTIGREDTKFLLPRVIEKQRFIDNIVEPMLTNMEKEDGISRDRILGGSDIMDKNMLAFNGDEDGHKHWKKFAQYYTLQDPNGLGPKELAAMQSDFEATKLTYNGELMAVWVLDPKISIPDSAKIESFIKTYCPQYTFDQLEYDHELTQYTLTSRPPALFKMALEYRLDELGVTVRLPANGIRFNEAEYQLEHIAILPWMGAGSNEHTGYTFFPDGSGAIFRFEDLNTGKVQASIYGQDFAYHNATEIKHQEVVRYPVFGLVEDVPIDERLVEDDSKETTVSQGFVAILEEGESMAKVELNHNGTVSKYNSIYVLVNPRPKDQYVLSDAVSVGANTSVTVLSKRKYVDDYKIRYIMLTDPMVAAASDVTDFYDASWMGMATAYREYLESPYSTGTQKLPEDQQTSILTRLTEDDINENGIPLYIETFGAVQTIQKVLSIPVNKMVSLTSFSDIQKMYDQLSGYGIENVHFKLTGYYNGGMDSGVPYKFNIEKSVGGKEGFKELLADAKNEGYGVYVDFDFVYADMAATYMFDGLSNNRDLVKSIDDRYISKQHYSVTRQAYTSYFELAISPSRFTHFYDKVSEEYLSYNPIGISLSTLASDLNSDFDEDDPYNREDSKDFSKALLAKAAKDYNSVMVDSANAYAWSYIDHMVNAAVDSSRYAIASNSVPFMGVVLHGYVQFAGTPMNMEGNIGYAMLKAIENGAGLYFILSYDNTEILKEDIEFSQYYSVIYEIWVEELVERYNTVNSLIKDLQLNLIIDHQFLIGERVPDEDEVIADEKAAEEQVKLEEEQAYEMLKYSIINAINDTRFSLLNDMNAHRDAVNKDIAAFGSITGAGSQIDKLNTAFKNIDMKLIKEVVDARAAIDAAKEAWDDAIFEDGLRPSKEQLANQALLEQAYNDAKDHLEAVLDTEVVINGNTVKPLRQLSGLNTVTLGYVENFQAHLDKTEQLFAVAQMAYDALNGKYDEFVDSEKYEGTELKAQVEANYFAIKAIRDEICGDENNPSVLESQFDEYINTFYYVIKEIYPEQNSLDSIINGEEEKENDEYVYTKYTNDDGNIVAVTYGGKNGNDNEAKVTFILNYNFFDVTVKYNDETYTIEGFGYVKIEH